MYKYLPLQSLQILLKKKELISPCDIIALLPSKVIALFSNLEFIVIFMVRIGKGYRWRDLLTVASECNGNILFRIKEQLNHPLS